MKVGDLVTYQGDDWVGLIIDIRSNGTQYKTATVKWNTGQQCSHCERWLIKLETSETL